MKILLGKDSGSVDNRLEKSVPSALKVELDSCQVEAIHVMLFDLSFI